MQTTQAVTATIATILMLCCVLPAACQEEEEWSAYGLGPTSWYVERLTEFLDSIEWYMVNDILGVGDVHEEFVDVDAYVKSTGPASLGLPDERLFGETAVPDALFLSYYYDRLVEYDISIIGDARSFRNTSGIVVTVDAVTQGKTTSGRCFHHDAVMTATFDRDRNITAFRMHLDSLSISCWLGRIPASECAAVNVTF